MWLGKFIKRLCQQREPSQMLHLGSCAGNTKQSEMNFCLLYLTSLVINSISFDSLKSH